MMKKLGRIIPNCQQLCYAHGLQLVILDVFYQKQSKAAEDEVWSSASVTDNEDEIETFDDYNDEGPIVSGSTDHQNSLSINLDIFSLVNKVLRIVKIFKRSPLKNETLQKYVKEKYPNGQNVVLDCNTRLSSLLNMLERIVQIKLPIQKALLDLDEDIYFSNQEFSMISSVFEALSPIKISLEALCRRDTNLITAEATIKFLLEDIHKSQSHYQTRIMDAIDQRIVQRYIDASAVLQFLHNLSSQLAKKVISPNILCSPIIQKYQEKKLKIMNSR